MTTRIAILDPAAGMSGDMLLGALLDAGVSEQWLRELPTRLGFPDVEVRIARVTRAALAATKVDFVIPGAEDGSDHHHAPAGGHAHGHGRHVKELIRIIEQAPVSDRVRERAVRAFQLVGEAEGKVHGVPPEKVHLHEVGAVDAVLDIVGGIEGVEHLGAEAVYNLPVATGSGWVRAAHGELPVPAPATALLLEGIELAHGGPVTGEATTPTGAALLRVLSNGAPPARWRLTGTGWGAGTRNPDGYPNALRILLAETAEEAGVMEVVAMDVDDLSPEYVEPLRRAALEAGAAECVAWSTQGKKGRVSVRVEALAAPDRSAAVVDAFFRHSSTAGVRRYATLRSTLPRRETSVEVAPGVKVRVKIRQTPGGARAKAEYDDVELAAERLGRPALDIARDAERLAETEG